MDELKIDLPTEDQEHTNLTALHRCLDYEITSSVLFVFIVLFASNYLTLLMGLAAVVFAPYMLWRLYNAHRFGWIAGFMLTVGLPTLAFLFVDSENVVVQFMLSFLPLVTFYFYTWILRLSVKDWIEERQYEVTRT